MSTGKTGRCPVSLFYICFVSAEDILLVSTADICPGSTADICPVTTEDICPVQKAERCNCLNTTMWKPQMVGRAPNPQIKENDPKWFENGRTQMDRTAVPKPSGQLPRPKVQQQIQ